MSAVIRRVCALAGAALFVWGLAGPGAFAQVSAAGPVAGQALLGTDQKVGTLADGGISSNLPNLKDQTTGQPAPRSAQAADDFIVQTASTNQYWRIQTISVLGQNVSAPTVDQVYIRIYADAGGLPGSLLLLQSSTSFSGAPNYVVNTNFILQGSPTGRIYWVSVQANVTSSTGLPSWIWQASSNGGAGLNESAWIDTTDTNVSQPLNFNLCLAQWGPRKSFCNIPQGTSQPDLAFRLDGDVITLSNRLFLPAMYR